MKLYSRPGHDLTYHSPIIVESLVAPFRVSVLSMVANLVIEANRFQSVVKVIGLTSMVLYALQDLIEGH